MDLIRKIPKKFTKKFGNKVTNRQYFCRKTGLEYVNFKWPFFVPTQRAWKGLACSFWHSRKGNRNHNYLLTNTHLSTAVAWREKKFKHFVFNKYFSLVLGLLKSRISEKINQLLLNKLDFKLFHYKARVQPVSKITTIATRNRC